MPLHLPTTGAVSRHVDRGEKAQEAIPLSIRASSQAETSSIQWRTSPTVNSPALPPAWALPQPKAKASRQSLAPRKRPRFSLVRDPHTQFPRPAGRCSSVSRFLVVFPWSPPALGINEGRGFSLTASGRRSAWRHDGSCKRTGGNLASGCLRRDGPGICLAWFPDTGYMRLGSLLAIEAWSSIKWLGFPRWPPGNPTQLRSAGLGDTGFSLATAAKRAEFRGMSPQRMHTYILAGRQSSRGLLFQNSFRWPRMRIAPL